ncbi:hypothetical protein BS50DRAFT_99437 [Corynespora cassiicola Philippines]|uniref:Uncharacterized protein n=1 Tax=Corynespora cassiicola Philippines TaxID=1448308 RepID=A0A2T2NFX4_CORCC|nr:hypothetical protein BS50DRAFT_99437 [Corynespora cassiicola Philippines]
MADWQTKLHYRDFQRAADPCKTCEFCVQGSMLSVRYPEYAQKQPSIMDSSDVQPLNRLDLGSRVRTLYEDAISDCMQDVWAQCARFADEEEKIRALGIQGTCKSLLKYLKMKAASHFKVLRQLEAYEPGLAEFSSKEGPAMAVYMIQGIREDMKIDKLLDREIALAWNRSQDPAKYGREEDDWPVGFESLDKTFLDGHDQDGNRITIGPEILKRLDPDMVKEMLHSLNEVEGGMELSKDFGASVIGDVSYS